jgi:GR25 family glycosyltransferase involved in LPS biosynthesis
MKLENLFEESYCINLKSRPDRWETMQNEFYKINFYPKRFEAVVDKNPVRGCYLSHLELLRKANKSKKSLLVFEDDCEFYAYEKDTIEKSLDELYNRDWWIFYLGANIMRPFYQVSDHLARLNWAQSTHAYGINKEHLSEILDFVENNNSFIDVIYTNIVAQVPCYVTIPLVAIQRTDYSDIEHCEMSYDVPIKRYWENLVRLKK